MIIDKLHLSKIAKHMYMRIDTKFWDTINNNIDSELKLKDIFYIINGIGSTEDYTLEKTSIPYIRISDLSNKDYASYENIIYLDEDANIPDNKFLKKGDLVLATIGSVGKASLADAFIGGTISNNIAILRLKDNTNHIPKFYHYLFQSDYFTKYIFGVASQKAQPNLQSYDLNNINLPIVDYNTQLNIVKEIELIEPIIDNLKNCIVDEKEIIDQVFINEFSFDIDKLNIIENSKIMSADYDELSLNNQNLRMGLRWNKAIKLQNEMFSNCNCVEKLGKYIINTQNGWSPSCSDAESENAVLGIDSINMDTVLTFDNIKYSDESRDDIDKYYVRNGDSFVSRGNTPELVALASIANIDNTEVDYIFPDLMIKIELSNEINKHYVAYVINSLIGRLYFKYVSKGKNLTMVKISSLELNEFLIPVPSTEKQIEIVNKIKKEIDKQNILKQNIIDKRNEIENIITNAIKKPS